MNIIKEFDISEPIVAMCTYKDMVVIATAKRVFRMKDGNAEQVSFEENEEVKTEGQLEIKWEKQIERND